MKGWPNCQAKSSTAFVLPQGRSHSGVTKSDYLELSRAWLRPTFRPVFPSLHESDYGATSNLLLSCGIEIFWLFSISIDSDGHNRGQSAR